MWSSLGILGLSDGMYCALLQSAVTKSWRHPYETLNRFAIAEAQLTYIKMCYNAYDDLNLDPEKAPQTNQFSAENCESDYSSVNAH